MTNLYVYTLAVSTNGIGNANLLAGTDGGVFLSTNNGINWTAFNNGLTNKSPFLFISPASRLPTGRSAIKTVYFF